MIRSVGQQEFTQRDKIVAEDLAGKVLRSDWHFGLTNKSRAVEGTHLSASIVRPALRTVQGQVRVEYFADAACRFGQVCPRVTVELDVTLEHLTDAGLERR